MKREIKFRGKDKVTGVWRYGYFAILKNEFKEWHCIMTEDDASNNYIKQANAYKMIYTAVLPETLGQFSGLLDKNGKEIYEGDILKITDKEDEDYSISPVLFRFGVFGVENWTEYRLTSLSFFIPSKYGTETEYEIEVIGNIVDNPELNND